MTETNPPLLSDLRSVCGNHGLLSADGDMLAYGYDNSRLHRMPLAVAIPADEKAVNGIIRICRRYQVPVTTRGRGTNTTGASVPEPGGIILSTEKLNNIIEYRPEDRFIRVQPGVTNGEVRDLAARDGLFWAPDPTSTDVCSIGGNLAMNAAGPRAVKYGSTRNHVLGIRAVSGAGELFSVGAITSKSVVGYDLTRLIIGSEGTLAVITEATLQLLPLQPARATIRLLYRDIDSASHAVSSIMRQHIIPSALEFMDTKAIDIVREHGNVDTPANAGALLMVEVEGQAGQIHDDAQTLIRSAGNPGLVAQDIATSREQIQALWQMRKALSPALRKLAPNKINEDVVVPVSRIPALINGLNDIGSRHGITIVNFGHAGNGNIHVNLLYDSQNPDQAARAIPCLDSVFDLVLSLGGSLSGEHGIGEVKREFVSRELNANALMLMRAIKQQFDPDNILNPGKALPAED
ncbi:MAG: FAD-binding protein [Gammaproteobacteria bacterium]|nr:FAD-binding protein [Gammaproteobacteria bacterium]